MGYFSLKEYALGEVRECEAAFRGEPTGSGGRRVTPEQSRKWYERKRARAVRLVMEANFSPGDPWVCLKYRAGTRKKINEVSKDLSKFCRYLRDNYHSRGQELKWIARIEVGKLGGTHVHIILNHCEGANDLALITKAWQHEADGASRPDVQCLEGPESWDQLADYITKEARSDDEQIHLPGTIEEKKAALRIRSSRNLIRPEPKRTRISRRQIMKLIEEGPKPAEGYSVIPDSVERGENPVTGTPYIRWRERRISRSPQKDKMEHAPERRKPAPKAEKKKNLFKKVLNHLIGRRKK